MKKTIVLVSFLAVFLLLMMPNVNSIEFNQVKEIQEKSYADILTDDLSLKRVLTLLKEFNKDEWTCDELQEIYGYCFVMCLFAVGIIFIVPVVLLIWSLNKAIEMGCDWVNDLPHLHLSNMDTLCSSCNK